MQSKIPGAPDDCTVREAPGASRRAVLYGLTAVMLGGCALFPWRRALLEVAAQGPGGLGELTVAYWRAQRHGKPVLVWLDGDPSRKPLKDMDMDMLLDLSRNAALAPLAICEPVHMYAWQAVKELGLDRDTLFTSDSQAFHAVLIETTGLWPVCAPCLPAPMPAAPPSPYPLTARGWRCFDFQPPEDTRQQLLKNQLDRVIRTAEQTAIAVAPGLKEISQRAKDTRAALSRQRLAISMGGAFAIDYALHAPSRVNRLVLLAPAMTLVSMRAAFFLNGIPLFFGTAGTERFMRYIGSKQNAGHAPYETRLRTMVEWFMIASRHFGMFQAVGVEYPKVLSDEQLRTLHQKTLVIIGEQEVIYDAKKAMARAALIPNVQTALIPRAGHDICWAQPERLNTTITEFLTSR